MSYFVQVQAVRSEVGSLVHQAAIFRSDTEVLDDIEIDAATVYERGFGLLVDAGVCRLRIIGWMEHQRSSATERVRPETPEIHRNVCDKGSRDLMKIRSYG